MCGALAAVQSRPARMPASGPAKSGTLSGITGSLVSAKRAGLPLALRIRPAHCGQRRSSTRSRIFWPPMSSRILAPPPIRRASPPARMRPKAGATSIVMDCGFAPMLGALLFDVAEVLIKHDAFLAGERDEAFAARAADQCQVRLAREFDAPSGEAG